MKGLHIFIAVLYLEVCNIAAKRVKIFCSVHCMVCGMQF